MGVNDVTEKTAIRYRIDASRSRFSVQAIAMADVAAITKMDLAAAVEFDSDAVNKHIQAVHPGMRTFSSFRQDRQRHG